MNAPTNGPVIESYRVIEDDKDLHVVNVIMLALRRHLPGEPVIGDPSGQVSHARALAALDYARNRVALADERGRPL